MREKQLRLVVAFHTTAGAMAAERLCPKALAGGPSHLRAQKRDLRLRHRLVRAAGAPPHPEARFQEAGIDAAGYYERMV